MCQGESFSGEIHNQVILNITSLESLKSTLVSPDWPPSHLLLKSVILSFSQNFLCIFPCKWTFYQGNNPITFAWFWRWSRGRKKGMWVFHCPVNNDGSFIRMKRCSWERGSTLCEQYFTHLWLHTLLCDKCFQNASICVLGVAIVQDLCRNTHKKENFTCCKNNLKTHTHTK